VSENYFERSKIAVFSDLHIGIHQNSRTWHTIAQHWAQWMVQELQKHNIKDVVFCGDYFHTRDEVSVDTLHFGARLLEMFQDFNVTLITGNHDCYLKDSSAINSLEPFKHWNNVTVVSSSKQVESHGKKISFVPWGVSVSDIPINNDILFGHFEINLFKMNTFFICDHGIEAKDLLQRSNLIVSGHFHLRDERKYGGGTILYVGNPFEMDFNDAGASKGYYILDVSDSTYVFHENTISPKHHNVTLSSLVQAGTITPQHIDAFHNNLVKLKIDRRISPDDTDVLLTKLKMLQPRQLVVEYETNFNDYDVTDRKDLSSIDIEQAIREFIDLMDINNRKEVIEYTVDLYKRICK
jgi:DNA repair exonuclease SbcCD nuclease subunit